MLYHLIKFYLSFFPSVPPCSPPPPPAASHFSISPATFLANPSSSASVAAAAAAAPSSSVSSAAAVAAAAAAVLGRLDGRSVGHPNVCCSYHTIIIARLFLRIGVLAFVHCWHAAC